MPADRVIVRPIRNHGHNQLARDISAEDQNLCPIELRRVNKLAKAYIRTMNIRREIQTHSAHHGKLLYLVWKLLYVAHPRTAHSTRFFMGRDPRVASLQ